MAGVRSGRIIPALQNVAHLRDHPQPTLDRPAGARAARHAGPRGARPGSAWRSDLERLLRRRSRAGAAPGRRRARPRLQQAGLT